MFWSRAFLPPLLPPVSNQVSGEKDALIGRPALVGGAYPGLGAGDWEERLVLPRRLGLLLAP